MTMTVEEAAEWFVAIWDPNKMIEGRTPYECALEIIQAQRKAAVIEASIANQTAVYDELRGAKIMIACLQEQLRTTRKAAIDECIKTLKEHLYTEEEYGYESINPKAIEALKALKEKQ